jgi:hypothetical protein
VKFFDVASALMLLSLVAVALSPFILATEVFDESVTLPSPVDTCSWAHNVVIQEVGRRGERLPGYALYGPICIEMGGTREREVTAEARQFIWSHWRAHERGVAIMTIHTKEGEPTTSFLYVEPSARGQWQVRLVIDRLVAPRGRGLSQSGTGEYIHRRDLVTANAMRRIEVPHDGLSPRETIGDSIVRDPSSYLLSFQSENDAHSVEF